MEAEDLDRYRELLLAKQRELLAARSSNSVLTPPRGESRGDLVEQARAEAETKVHIRLRQTESHLLQVIDEALTRIAQRSFGLCGACRHPISKARLNAVPWTRLCRDCKEQRYMAA